MILKKLIFAPPFIVLSCGILFLYSPLLNQYLEIFFKPYGGLYELSLVTTAILLSSLCYGIYITLTQDIKFALVAAILASAIPFFFLSSTLALVISIGFLISLTITYFNLQTSLRSYINFQASALLTAPIKLLSTFILLTLTFGYFLSTNSIIKTQGFEVPETLIDWAVDLSLKGQGPPVLGKKYIAQTPTLTQEQLEMLKQNPQILEQYGLGAEDLEQFVPEATTPTTSPNKNAVSVVPQLQGANLRDVIKAQISNTLDEIIQPYLFAIPFLLALMFYSLGSLTLWIGSLFLSPLISLIFYLFEKSGFIKFEKEMREVKKIVI